MSIGLYTTDQLLGVLQSLANPPITFFRDRWFTQETQSTDESIHFDVIDKKRRLAPYVSPLVQGKVMQHRGFSTKVFQPAYVKPKHILNPNEMLKRRAGEPFGGSLTPEQRRDAALVNALEEQDQAIEMLEEVQCSEALRTGKITVAGDGYGTVSIDFGRHADLTVALTGGDRWGQTGVKPLANIETWAGMVRDKSDGAIVRDVVLGTTAWALLKASLTEQERKDLFDSLRGSRSSIELGPRLAEKVQFQGQIGEYSFWTYKDTYQNASGTDVEIMPVKEVVLLSSSVEGIRAYGAIRDVREMRAVRRFPKNWEEQDPSVEYLMTQSSFLMVPLRPNATLGATVDT
ncbi:MAG: major capsid protein [Vicinamibacterales bacterium]